jgi:chromosome segregation ATPase
MKKKLILTLPVITLGLVLPALQAGEPAKVAAEVESNYNEVKGDAAKAALKEIDAEIDAVDAMIDHAPTQAEKDAAKARMDVLKERRSELRKTYTKSRYEELKADIRAEANKFSAWTKRTFTRDPADKAADDVRDATREAKRDAKRAGDEVADASRDAARDANRAVKRAGDNAYAYGATAGAALDLNAYKMRPTDTNKEEAKAAIKALDQKIEALEDRVDDMPRGADRDAAKRRVKALEDRKDELKHEFNKARFDALVDDVQGSWNDLVHN